VLQGSGEPADQEQSDWEANPASRYILQRKFSTLRTGWVFSALRISPTKTDPQPRPSVRPPALSTAFTTKAIPEQLNIFDILFSSNRSVTEEHVTGFLSWLLDPTQTHGAGTVFLERVLKASILKTHPTPNILSDWLNPHTVAYREVRTAVETMTEREVVTNTGKKRSIDIVLFFWRIDSNGERKREYVVAVENKIRNESIADDAQLTAIHFGKGCRTSTRLSRLQQGEIIRSIGNLFHPQSRIHNPSWSGGRFRIIPGLRLVGSHDRA
jgi:hypothetical protein